MRNFFNIIYDYITYLFSDDNIAEQILESVQSENSYKYMDYSELEINQKYNKETTALKEFNLDPNKTTILIVDDYIGIMKTPEMIIQTSEDLNLKDYNIMKFWGINSGKEVLYYLDENPDTKIDIGIIDILINGLDGVDIVHKIKESNPDLRFMFYSGIDIESNEYKANKARAKFKKFLPEYNFLDKIILKSSSFKDVIAPSMYKLIKG